MRYYKDLIVDAQHEVILATNYWEQSWGSHLYVHAQLTTCWVAHPLDPQYTRRAHRALAPSRRTRAEARRQAHPRSREPEASDKEPSARQRRRVRGSRVPEQRPDPEYSLRGNGTHSDTRVAGSDLTGFHFSAQNYHRPIVGTFHSKYMVIDRRIACVSSNNIQVRIHSSRASPRIDFSPCSPGPCQSRDEPPSRRPDRPVFL